jgi:Fur family ferric uptake transcriptional regulator
MDREMKADKYVEVLRSRRLKATPTRLLVLEILDRAQGPQSAEVIHEQASTHRPTDKVTVYRTLEALYRAGLVEKARAGGRAWLYHLIAALGHENHPHFLCSGCGSLECLPPDTVNLDYDRLRSVFPARLDHLRISLDGVCPKCLAEREQSSG